jgi:hypothetical protein
MLSDIKTAADRLEQLWMTTSQGLEREHAETVDGGPVSKQTASCVFACVCVSCIHIPACLVAQQQQQQPPCAKTKGAQSKQKRGLHSRFCYILAHNSFAL